MQLTRLSTLALLALAGMAFQAATAVPTHQQASGAQPASSQEQVSSDTDAAHDLAPPASDAPAASVTPTAPVTREAASSIPLAERMEFVQQQQERTTQRGKEMEAQQGTVVQAAATFTQVDGKCPVCQNEAQEEEAVFVSDCGHFVHEKCLKKTPTTDREKCPVCRAARTQGSVDKLGESLHFVPAEEGGLPAVTKRFAKLLNKIVASPKDVCDNEPSKTDGWSCFRDDKKDDEKDDKKKDGKKIYATEAVLDAVVKSVEGATHSGCASKEAAAPGVTFTQSQQTAPAADLFTTVSLPGGADWGKINVQVQCLDQTSQQGLVKVTDYPEVVLAPAVPDYSDPEEENRLARIQELAVSGPLIATVETYTASNYAGNVDAAATALATRFVEALAHPELCTDVSICHRRGTLCPSDVRLSADSSVVSASLRKIDEQLLPAYTLGPVWSRGSWEVPGFSDDATVMINSYRKDGVKYFFVVEDAEEQ